ncbi:GNAT family N-acetyltransferase [Gudongella sp. DL1XJH-153]|uniref:GNAT family N-acetyltransferase n=1 Tax=Gudongella sp. DL1XJH-153 TaxID=3409804 RepID=UPI003BB7BB6C
MNIRRANPKEHEILTDLAVTSESYWGYDKKFLSAFRSIYGLSEDYIMNHPTFVMEDDDEIIGFYNLIESDEEVTLEYFYIDPVNIRKGYGSQLWEHLVEFCKNRGILELQFVSSPEARKFYEKMGAVVVGEADSRVMTDRRILKWKFVV